MEVNMRESTHYTKCSVINFKYLFTNKCRKCN